METEKKEIGKMENGKMDRDKLIEKIKNDEKLYRKIVGYSWADNESDWNSRKLWITIWKDGEIGISLTEIGNDYPPETYDAIEEIIKLDRNLLYQDFDREGIPENKFEEEAIKQYESNFDLGEFFSQLD
jgi:hypothetical protein